MRRPASSRFRLRKIFGPQSVPASPPCNDPPLQSQLFDSLASSLLGPEEWILFYRILQEGGRNSEVQQWYDMIWYDMIWYDMIWYDMMYSRFFLFSLQPAPWNQLATQLGWPLCWFAGGLVRHCPSHCDLAGVDSPPFSNCQKLLQNGSCESSMRATSLRDSYFFFGFWPVLSQCCWWRGCQDESNVTTWTAARTSGWPHGAHKLSMSSGHPQVPSTSGLQCNQQLKENNHVCLNMGPPKFWWFIITFPQKNILELRTIYDFMATPIFSWPFAASAVGRASQSLAQRFAEGSIASSLQPVWVPASVPEQFKGWQETGVSTTKCRVFRCVRGAPDCRSED